MSTGKLGSFCQYNNGVQHYPASVQHEAEDCTTQICCGNGKGYARLKHVRQTLTKMNVQAGALTNSEFLKLEEITWEHLNLLEKAHLVKLEEIVLVLVGRHLRLTGLPLKAVGESEAMKVTFPLVLALCTYLSYAAFFTKFSCSFHKISSNLNDICNTA